MVLMRSTDGHQLKQPQQPNPLATKRQQQQQPEGKIRQQQSDNGNDLDGQDGPNRTRQLVRVYTASKEVVEEIAAATEHHLATDRLYPVKNHHHSHHKYRRRRPNHHHHHPLRPSMLIELRQLQYVREYHLPVRSQLLRVRCDVFEPAESIYYCFIYVVLHRGAVHFESLPYCVPTTLTASSTAAEDDDDEAVVKGGDNGDDQRVMKKSRRQKQRKIMMRRRGPALSGVNNRISGNGGNGRRPLYPFLIDPPSTPSENEQQQKQKQKQQQQHLITLGRADLIASDSSSSSSPTQKWYQMNDDHRQSGGQQQHYSLQTDNSISEHFNNNAERKASADEAGAAEDYDYDPLQQIRSLIPPPGPAAFGSARTRKDEEESEDREDQMNSLPPDNAVDYEETAELDHRSTKEKEDNNIRQFALKSSDSLPSSSSSGSSSSLQSDYHRQQQQQQSPIVVGQRIGGNNGNNNNSKGDKVATQRKRTKTKKTPALSVQRRSCYCSNSADLRPSSSSTSSTSILRLNLTTSETTVLHLVITSCPAASEEEEEDEDERKEIQSAIDNSSSAVADDDENLLDSSGENSAANYILGSSESGRHLKDAEVSTTTITSTAKTTDKDGQTKANNNKTKKDRRKGKGKKERKDRKNHHQPTEPLSTTSTTTTTTSTTSTTTTEASTSTSSSSSSTLPSSTTTTPTVCILSIENPLQYSFKLDSIEPSLDWPAGIFDGHSMQGGGLDLPGPEEQGGKAATGEGPLDFLDWLRRFPFLVVRSGQRAIDPQMNIENRSATHFLRSGGHLRFEALSSLNVTLRFRRSPQPTLAHTRDSQHTTLQHSQSSELEEDHKDSSSSLSSAFHSVRAAVDGAISYFAYHLAVNSAGDSGGQPTSVEDSAALAQLTAFHLTSMLLSLFILATLAIFAVIAYLQASKEEDTTSRRVQIRTPEEEFDMDSSPSHPQQSSGASEDQQMMQQLYGSSSQQASTSRGSKHHQSTKSPSFTLEQQSLEMDYYDYVAPLTIVEHHHHQQQQSSTYETLTNHQQQQQQTLEHTSTADSTTSSTCHHFRTLPIKVNSPNSSLSRNKQLSLVKQNNTTTNTTSSCCSLAAAASGNGGGTSLVRAGGGGGGGQSSAACSAAGAQSTSGYVINDHNSQQQQLQQQQPNSNSGSSTEAERMVATLARLSFTKPPVLLSTFRPSAGAGE